MVNGVPAPLRESKQTHPLESEVCSVHANQECWWILFLMAWDGFSCGIISMFTFTWASLIKSHCISRCNDCIHFYYIGFKDNVLKSKLNMIFKGEAQSRITTTLPLQSTLESTGASPLSTFFFSPFAFLQQLGCA